MTQPSVNIEQQDGALGVLPATAGKLLGVVGPSSKGPINVPSTYGRVKDLINDFGQGAGVEAAALHILRTGKPVVFVRTASTTVGAVTGVAKVGTGTSVVTVSTSSVTPLDDYELYVLVNVSGTIGTAGIAFQWSLDGGRTMSPRTALGTANSFEIPDSGVMLAFAAGTLVAGDTVTARTTSPRWSDAELAAALTALGNTVVRWEIVEVVGSLDGSSFDTVETQFANLYGRGKYQAWMGHFRMPNAAETEAAYLTAFQAAFGQKTTIFGAVCSGAAEITSAVSGRRYRRPHIFATASREAASSEEVNQADVNLGSLILSITDDNGNPKHHDESINPGLDDARSYVLRTWGSDIEGVYVNRPLLLSPTGSDFRIMPHRRVMNLALATIRAYFIRRLNREIVVDKKTGFILEDEALEIEYGLEQALESVLMAKPKASGYQVALSRLDNLLANAPMNGDVRVIPLAYPEQIIIRTGFLSPAVTLVRGV